MGLAGKRKTRAYPRRAQEGLNILETMVKEVTVKFSFRFRGLFGTPERRVELEDDASVRDLLGVLCDTEARSKGIFGSDGDLRQDVMLTKNGLFVLYLNRLDTQLENGDVVNVFYPACMG